MVIALILFVDSIIDTNISNQELFHSNIKEKLPNLLKGINLSIFAYGQTSTGKTFTMRGNNDTPGIIQLAINEIFTLLKTSEQINSYEVKVSYLEIYNESLNDLLDPLKKNLDIRESTTRGIFVENLTEVSTDSLEKAIHLLMQGDNVKITAETKLNEKSSRSHTIFRIILKVKKQEDGKMKTLTSQFNLIDLAGSENVSKAKTEGLRLREGSNINKSLLALSNVIHGLAFSKSFVNYRDSKLTRLLQPALAGNSKTMIICTLSQNPSSYQESLNTLHFGAKAKSIKTLIKINEVIDEKAKVLLENSQLKQKIRQLEEMISEKKGIDYNSQAGTTDEINSKLKNQNEL